MLNPNERWQAQFESLIKLEQEILRRHGVHTPVIPEDKLHLFEEVNRGLAILTGEKAGVIAVTV
jgi:hypothetical protein